MIGYLKIWVIGFFLGGLLLTGSCVADSNENGQNESGDVKTDRVLMSLFGEYQQFVARGGVPEEFVSRQLNIRSARGFVTIEGIAQSSGEELALQLKRLGATDIAYRGLNVSCRLPLASIPGLSEVGELRYARPSYEKTR